MLKETINSSNNRYLEVVIPVKNEQKNIGALIRELHHALTQGNINYKLIFIVDKSTDNTIAILKRLQKSYHIEFYEKQGKGGKGYSLMEGFEHCTSEFVAFIDGDLQYPPSAIPAMLDQLLKDTKTGVIVANRVTYESTWLRKFGSRANKFVFGTLMLGLKCDIQSGLKLFRRDIFKHINKDLVTAWTFDIPLLHAATELGYNIDQVDINFVNRRNGVSNVGFAKTAIAIASCAIKTRLTSKRVYDVGGIIYNKKHYITHNRLPHHKTALYTLGQFQKLFVFFILIVIALGLIVDARLTALIIVAILSTIYFLDVLFNTFVVMKSLHSPPELEISENKIKSLSNENLPVYTILCPLYKEAEVLPHFVDNVSLIDWPKEKLEVLLLLEEDDEVTINAAKNMDLPNYVKAVVVPHSNPKTKPKACNYGLNIATGEYIVVYDAEDRAEPLQLKKAFLAFQEADEKLFCIQAKLNYYNPHDNLLTRLFTAEYSLWFDVMLPGLQSINTTIPLGGTSNHFKTEGLKRLHGWDAFNVTEDLDLGVRLFKEGFNTAIINSTTLEEANSSLKNWIRQRSRWIKGYFQSYLVHMREPISFAKNKGIHFLIFQLIIGLRISFILINPILWLATISYFVLYAYVGPTIEALYPTPVFYMAATSLVFGNFIYLYNYMIGSAKRGHWSVIKYVFLIPLYWVMTSIAAIMAFQQLIFKPHYWEKTIHGLKLGKVAVPNLQNKSATKSTKTFKKPVFSPLFWNGGVLIASTLVANFANFAYNAYLGREVNLSQFGTVTLISNIFAISAVVSNSLGKTVAYKTAYLLGKLNVLNNQFYLNVRRFTLLLSVISTIIWVLSIPFLANFFNETEITPFLLFTPYWMITFVGSINSGFLSGTHKFKILGVSMFIEAITKVLLAVVAVKTGYVNLVYAIPPVSILLAFLFEAINISKMKSTPTDQDEDFSFPVGYYMTSIFTKISSVIFLSADVILAKHYLSPEDAGRYALLSLAGKIVYFLGTLLSQFIIPIVSKEEGKKANTKNPFYTLLIGSGIISFIGFIGIGLLGSYTIPFLFGEKAVSIVPLLPKYTLAMLIFNLAAAIVSYHQIKKQYIFTLIPLVIAGIEIILIATSTSDILSFVNIIFVLAYVQLASMITLHFTYPYLEKYISNYSWNTTNNAQETEADPEKLNIVIFNWRDIKHIWSGGAEVYIHELAKIWANDGHNVTLVCSNDKRCLKEETIDGVKIIRKGGFYTVYLFAALYYIFNLRKNTDIVIDSENGIPFFSPLFVRKPVILLIHHVHKDIVLNQLKLPKYLLPMALIAKILESKLMPFIYKNSKIVAVSESTRADIVKLGFQSEIEIIHPGVDTNKFRKSEKSEDPSILYVGRIKHYKSIDTLIKAHKLVIEKFPNAKLFIAGDGEAKEHLEELTKNIGLDDNVALVGKITEDEKVELLGNAWVFAYPSTMEGWGISVMEASASGTAVVASNVPGLRDSVQNTNSGYLVEQGNVEEFANVIIKIISDKNLRNKLGESGIKWAENFTWERSAEKYIKLIANIGLTNKYLGKKFVFVVEGN